MLETSEFTHYHLGLNDIKSFSKAMGISDKSVSVWLTKGKCPLKHQDKIELIREMHCPIDELDSNELVCFESKQAIFHLNAQHSYEAYCICFSSTNSDWSWHDGGVQDKTRVNIILLRTLLNISLYRNPKLKNKLFGFSELCRIRKESKENINKTSINEMERNIWEFIYIKSSSVILSYIFKQKEHLIRDKKNYRDKLLHFAFEIFELVKNKNKKYLKGEVSFNTLNLISLSEPSDFSLHKEVVNEAISVMVAVYGKNQTLTILKKDPDTKSLIDSVL